MMQKLLTIVTLACFMVSSVFGDAFPAVAGARERDGRVREILGEFAFPQSCGRVTGAQFRGSRQLVIAVQDLHCHPEVQRNIAGILAALDARFGLKNVYVEGGYGDVDTSRLCNIEDRQLKKEIVENLIDQGRLTGSEYYSILSNRPGLLKGIEDETIHKANVRRLGAILERRNELEKTLAALEGDLARMRADHFGARNRTLAALIEQHRAGKIPSYKYYRQLRRYVETMRRDPDAYPAVFAAGMEQYPHLQAYLALTRQARQLHYKRISRQLQEFMRRLKSRLPYQEYAALLEKTADCAKTDELYLYLAKIAEEYPGTTAGLADLATFFEYTEKSRALNPTALLREERRLVGELRRGFSRSVGEIETAFLTDFFVYFKEYALTRLSAEDYAYFCARFEKFRTLWGKYAASDRLAGLSDDFALLDDYYRSNCRRNACFLGNVPLAGGNADARQTPNGEPFPSDRTVQEALKGSELIVIVAGGFHTEGLNDLLRERNISCLTVTPNVTQNTDISNIRYERFAREQAELLAQALQLGLASQFSSPVLFELALKAANRKLREAGAADRARLVQEIEKSVGIRASFEPESGVVTLDNGAQIRLDVREGRIEAQGIAAGETVSDAVRAAVRALADAEDFFAALMKAFAGSIDELLSCVARLPAQTAAEETRTENLRELLGGMHAELENRKVVDALADIVVRASGARASSPFIVGIGGGSGAGKSTLARELEKTLARRRQKVAVIKFDEFFKSGEERTSLGTEWDENHVRLDAAADFLASVRQGAKKIRRQAYKRFFSPSLQEETVDLDGVDIVIFEGLYAIAGEERLGNLLRFVDLPVYVDADVPLLQRWRFQREETKAHPRTPEQMRRHWQEGIAPDLAGNVLPSRQNAAVVIRKEANHRMTLMRADNTHPAAPAAFKTSRVLGTVFGRNAVTDAIDELFFAPLLELSRFAALLAAYRGESGFDDKVERFFAAHGYGAAHDYRRFYRGMAAIMATAARANVFGIPVSRLALLWGHGRYNWNERKRAAEARRAGGAAAPRPMAIGAEPLEAAPVSPAAKKIWAAAEVRKITALMEIDPYAGKDAVFDTVTEMLLALSGNNEDKAEAFYQVLFGVAEQYPAEVCIPLTAALQKESTQERCRQLLIAIDERHPGELYRVFAGYFKENEPSKIDKDDLLKISNLSWYLGDDSALGRAAARLFSEMLKTHRDNIGPLIGALDSGDPDTARVAKNLLIMLCEQGGEYCNFPRPLFAALSSPHSRAAKAEAATDILIEMYYFNPGLEKEYPLYDRNRNISRALSLLRGTAKDADPADRALLEQLARRLGPGIAKVIDGILRGKNFGGERGGVQEEKISVVAPAPRSEKEIWLAGFEEMVDRELSAREQAATAQGAGEMNAIVDACAAHPAWAGEYIAAKRSAAADEDLRRAEVAGMAVKEAGVKALVAALVKGMKDDPRVGKVEISRTERKMEDALARENYEEAEQYYWVLYDVADRYYRETCIPLLVALGNKHENVREWCRQLLVAIDARRPGELYDVLKKYYKTIDAAKIGYLSWYLGDRTAVGDAVVEFLFESLKDHRDKLGPLIGALGSDDPDIAGTAKELLLGICELGKEYCDFPVPLFAALSDPNAGKARAAEDILIEMYFINPGLERQHSLRDRGIQHALALLRGAAEAASDADRMLLADLAENLGPAVSKAARGILGGQEGGRALRAAHQEDAGEAVQSEKEVWLSRFEGMVDREMIAEQQAAKKNQGAREANSLLAFACREHPEWVEEYIAGKQASREDKDLRRGGTAAHALRTARAGAEEEQKQQEERRRAASLRERMDGKVDELAALLGAPKAPAQEGQKNKKKDKKKQQAPQAAESAEKDAVTGELAALFRAEPLPYLEVVRERKEDAKLYRQLVSVAVNNAGLLEDETLCRPFLETLYGLDAEAFKRIYRKKEILQQSLPLRKALFALVAGIADPDLDMLLEYFVAEKDFLPELTDGETCGRLLSLGDRALRKPGIRESKAENLKTLCLPPVGQAAARDGRVFAGLLATVAAEPAPETQYPFSFAAFGFALEHDDGLFLRAAAQEGAADTLGLTLRAFDRVEGMNTLYDGTKTAFRRSLAGVAAAFERPLCAQRATTAAGGARGAAFAGGIARELVARGLLEESVFTVEEEFNRYGAYDERQLREAMGKEGTSSRERLAIAYHLSFVWAQELGARAATVEDILGRIQAITRATADPEVKGMLYRAFTRIDSPEHKGAIIEAFAAQFDEPDDGQTAKSDEDALAETIYMALAVPGEFRESSITTLFADVPLLFTELDFLPAEYRQDAAWPKEAARKMVQSVLDRIARSSLCRDIATNRELIGDIAWVTGLEERQRAKAVKRILQPAVRAQFGRMRPGELAAHYKATMPKLRKDFGAPVNDDRGRGNLVLPRNVPQVMKWILEEKSAEWIAWRIAFSRERWYAFLHPVRFFREHGARNGRRLAGMRLVSAFSYLPLAAGIAGVPLLALSGFGIASVLSAAVGVVAGVAAGGIAHWRWDIGGIRRFPARAVNHVIRHDDLADNIGKYENGAEFTHVWFTDLPEEIPAGLSPLPFKVNGAGLAHPVTVLAGLREGALVFYLDMAGIAATDYPRVLQEGAAQVMRMLGGTDAAEADGNVRQRIAGMKKEGAAAMEFAPVMAIDHTGNPGELRRHLSDAGIHKTPVVSAAALAGIPPAALRMELRKTLDKHAALAVTMSEYKILEMDVADIEGFRKSLDIFNAVGRGQMLVDWNVFETALGNRSITRETVKELLATAKASGVAVYCKCSAGDETPFLALGFAGVIAPDTMVAVRLDNLGARTFSPREVLDIRIPAGMQEKDIRDAFAKLHLANTMVFHSADAARLVGARDIDESNAFTALLDLLLGFAQAEIATPEKARRLGYNWDVSAIAAQGRLIDALADGRLEESLAVSAPALYEQAVELAPGLRRHFLRAVAAKALIAQSFDGALAEDYADGKFKFADLLREEMLGEALLRRRALAPEQLQRDQDVWKEMKAAADDNVDLFLLKSYRMIAEGNPQPGSISAVIDIILLDATGEYNLRKSMKRKQGTLNMRTVNGILGAA